MDKDMAQILKGLNPENVAQQLEKIEKLCKEGKSFKEASGISDAMENEIYVLAKHYYDQGKYNEAMALFQVLVSVNPVEYRYFFGLGSSFYQLQDYVNALLGFYGAFSVDNATQPLAPYYAADCFIKLDAPEDASKFLDFAISIAETVEPEKNKIIVERCKLIKKTLKPAGVSS